MGLFFSSVDWRDQYAKHHSDQVTILCTELAQQINLRADETRILQLSATLHDIGKLAISEAVVGKASRLTQAEILMIQQHPIFGYKLIKPLNMEPMLAAAILSHHENYDGSGYPEGLRGEQIPFAARLIRITDFYDSLTTNRSYRAGYDPNQALEILRQNRHCFDPGLFDAFVNLMTQKIQTDQGDPKP
ncbi:MAG: HD domain-containing protein [Chloroflexi bacterium]|nr:HD domain-containing protein [Chloroflexota bacterium]